MSNFDISPNFAINIKYARIGIICTFLFFGLMIFTIGAINIRIISMFCIAAFLASYVVFFFTYFLAGRCLYNMYDEDFVSGGDELLGGVMFFGLICPAIWLLVPIFTFDLFWKAKKYSNKHGFRERSTY